jgi:signal transduction histidine kinase/ligand-binding sensor domain-containing protein
MRGLTRLGVRGCCAGLIWVGLLPSMVGAQQWAVQSFKPEDGLASSQLWDVLQDSRGIVWIGTSSGLSRWDGNGFSSFTTADGLHNQVIRTMVEDSQGALWLGTLDGVVRFDGRSFVAFTSADGLGAGSVWASARDRYGNLWFGTNEGGVSVWTGHEFRTHTTADGLAMNYVYAVLPDSAGRVWLGHYGGGVTRCRADEQGGLQGCSTWSTANGLAHDAVRALVEDSHGNVWLGTRGGGLVRWDGQRFATFTTADGLAGNDVYDLTINRRGELVVGTRGDGVCLCSLPDLAACRTLGTGNGLADGSVHALLEDDEQVLWIALNNGLSRLHSEAIVSWTPADGVPDVKVYDLLWEPGGSLWIGTYSHLARLRTSSGRASAELQVWGSGEGLPSTPVWSLERGPRGSLWVGTADGLFRLDAAGRIGEPYTAADGLAATQVLSIAVGADHLWLGTTGGLHRARLEGPGRLTDVQTFTTADGLGGNACAALCVDREGRVWVGTGGRGLSVLDGGRLRTVTTEHGLVDNHVVGLSSSSDGGVWVGTNGGGLARVWLTDSATSGFAVEAFGRAFGVPGVVTAVVETDGGQLWLGTNRGAMLFDPAVARQGGVAVVRRVAVESGLFGSEVNAVARAGDRWWFAGNGGVSRYEPSRELGPHPEPRVVIDRVVTGSGRELRAAFSAPAELSPGQRAGGWLESDELVLDAGESSLHISFRVLSSRPQQMAVQTWLTTVDRDWVAAGGSRLREVSNLGPGRHEFRVRAARPGGTWGATAELAVVVEPAFWQTWPFAAAAVLAVAALVAGGHRARTYRMRVSTRRLKEEVAARTDELRRYNAALEEQSRELMAANARIASAERHKGQFLANMSHELRTPLNAIIGFSDVLLTRNPDRERQRRFLGSIRSSGGQLLELIDNLLDLSKLEAGKMRLEVDEVDLEELFEGVCEVMRGYAEDRQVSIESRVEPGLGTVQTDPGKLRQVLYNLLSNAVKFSHRGGVVELSARAVPARDSATGEAAFEVAVRDRGVGIDPEEHEAVFEAFLQGGDRRERPFGTGLGLTIVDQFVSMLGGSVVLESELGAGSTFTVRLPMVAEVELQPPSAAFDPQPDERSGPHSVLVVEPDRQSFEAVALDLESRGFVVVRAADAAEAARMLGILRPTVVLVGLSAADAVPVVGALRTPPGAVDG